LSRSDQSNRSPWFRRHPKITLLAIVVAGTLAFDVGSTAVLRACGLRSSVIDADGHYRCPHPVYHHDLRRRVSFDAARWGNLVYPMRTNSLGFRDASVREVSLVATGPRIVLIGDSFTEGIGVAYEDSFAGMLDARLGARGVEVLDAGVVSYSPTIYLAKTRWLIEHEGLRFGHLVAFLDLSDVEDELRHYRLDPEDGHVIELVYDRFDQRCKRFVGHHTTLVDGVRRLVRYLRKGSDEREGGFDDQLTRRRGMWTVDPAAFAEYGEAGLAIATENMDALAALLRQHDVELTVVVYPWPVQIARRDLDSLQVRHWRAWAERTGAGFVDCFPAFIDERPAAEVIEREFFRGDVHFNRRGHAAVAECVLRYLEPRLKR